MKGEYYRKLIAAYEAVDSLIVHDDDLWLENSVSIGRAVALLHSALHEFLEVDSPE